MIGGMSEIKIKSKDLSSCQDGSKIWFFDISFCEKGFSRVFNHFIPPTEAVVDKNLGKIRPVDNNLRSKYINESYTIDIKDGLSRPICVGFLTIEECVSAFNELLELRKEKIIDCLDKLCKNLDSKIINL